MIGHPVNNAHRATQLHQEIVQKILKAAFQRLGNQQPVTFCRKYYMYPDFAEMVRHLMV